MKLKLLLSQQVHLEVRRNRLFSEFAMQSYSRFLNKDWGDLPEEDAETNNRATVEGGDILGVYKMKGEPERKTVIVVVPAHRGFLQVMFKRELQKKKKDRQDYVLYGPDGRRLSN